MYFRRSLLLVESLAFIALTFSVSTTTRAADCKKFGKRVAALHLDLKSADSDILKQALRLALTTAHDDLETCRHPSPPLVPYSKVMPEAIGVPDPQIAVGEKYVLAVDTGRVAFFARTAKSVKLTPVYNNSARAIFTAVQTKLNIRLQVSDPRYKLYCNPAEPEKVLMEKALRKKGALLGRPPASRSSTTHARPSIRSARSSGSSRPQETSSGPARVCWVRELSRT